jgi:hypothetical protein
MVIALTSAYCWHGRRTGLFAWDDPLHISQTSLLHQFQLKSIDSPLPGRLCRLGNPIDSELIYILI